eukprot:evm.model.NODE_32430_length_6172_cov_19.914776.2
MRKGGREEAFVGRKKTAGYEGSGTRRARWGSCGGAQSSAAAAAVAAATTSAAIAFIGADGGGGRGGKIRRGGGTTRAKRTMSYGKWRGGQGRLKNIARE